VSRTHCGDRVDTSDEPLVENHWHEYWDRLEEHVFFRVEAEDYVARLAATLGPDLGARVLDFGCGFGFVAELLARKVPALFVFDTSDHMRRQAQLRLAGYANVRILLPPAVASWPEELRLDLVLVNSVVQYMMRDEFHGWLGRWQAMLAPGGRLALLIGTSQRDQAHQICSDLAWSAPLPIPLSTSRILLLGTNLSCSKSVTSGQNNAYH